MKMLLENLFYYISQNFTIWCILKVMLTSIWEKQTNAIQKLLFNMLYKLKDMDITLSLIKKSSNKKVGKYVYSKILASALLSLLATFLLRLKYVDFL